MTNESMEINGKNANKVRCGRRFVSVELALVVPKTSGGKMFKIMSINT